MEKDMYIGIMTVNKSYLGSVHHSIHYTGFIGLYEKDDEVTRKQVYQYLDKYSSQYSQKEFKHVSFDIENNSNLKNDVQKGMIRFETFTATKTNKLKTKVYFRVYFIKVPADETLENINKLITSLK